jgi:leader peptidase (prepilin peptidase) / N-methyltransferase
MVFAALAFWPGLALGSFLNVVAARVPLKRSIVRPPSACMACGHEIAWYDNVPVVSWVVLRGRCRSCGTGISFRYPAVELATALLVAGCFWRFGPSGRAVVGALFCCALVTIAATDLEHLKIPNRIVLPAAAAVLAAQTAVQPSPEWAISALAASAALFVLAIVYPAGMGMGDVKLALMLGAALGKTVIVAIMLGALSGAVFGVAVIARGGSRKTKIPFGVFLALGSIVALFAGKPLLHGYLTAFHK